MFCSIEFNQDTSISSFIAVCFLFWTILWRQSGILEHVEHKGYKAYIVASSSNQITCISHIQYMILWLFESPINVLFQWTWSIFHRKDKYASFRISIYNSFSFHCFFVSPWFFKYQRFVECCWTSFESCMWIGTKSDIGSPSFEWDFLFLFLFGSLLSLSLLPL